MPLRHARTPARAAAFGLAALSVAAPLASQPAPPRGRVDAQLAPSSGVRLTDGAGWLASRFGVAGAERDLASERAEDRLRAVERLGAMGTDVALDLLARALEPRGPLAYDARARLAAVRALAPRADRAQARDALVRTLTEPSGGALGALAQSTAALALAASGDPRAVGALLGAARGGGSAGAAAARALVAHPPRELALGKDAPTASLVRALADLDDPRALPLFHASLAAGAGPGSPTDLRREAARAVARLGDATVAAAVRRWVEDEDPRARLVAVEALLSVRAPDATAALVAALAAKDTASEAVDLAARAPGVALVAPLVAVARDADPELASRAVAAVARVDHPAAVAALAALLASPPLAFDAALGLARAPSDGARDALVRALSAGSTRRLAARALVTRALETGDTTPALRATLAALLRAADPSDRAVGAFGIAALEPARAAALVASDDGAVATAAARAAPVAGAAALEACARRLPGARSEAERAAFAVALAFDVAADVSRGELGAWIDERGPLAPLAARALAARDDEAVRPRVAELLGDADPRVRAAAARGLGVSRRTDAAAVLADAWRDEVDPVVRRALVHALAPLRDPRRDEALARAAALDPDAAARAAARLGLVGAAAAGEGAADGALVAWIRVAPAPATDAPRVAWLDAARGAARPVVPDPDGVALVPGVARGAAGLELAPRARTRDASPR